MEQVVFDQLEPCPYLEGKMARMPLRWQRRTLSPGQADASFSRGERRVGPMLYRTECPGCRACEPIRVPTGGLRRTRSMRRLEKRNQDVTVTVAPASYSEERLRLCNRHRLERGLATEPLRPAAYRGWFLASCQDTREVLYHVEGRLIAVSILDVGLRAASSVYHFYDPDESRRSLGTWSVMAEADWCLAEGIDWYYLGLYVAECRHLNYKARFRPHQRLIDGQWQDFS